MDHLEIPVCTATEVAVALGMSIKTVQTHRANIMKRLNCHSISELVRYALRNQIHQSLGGFKTDFAFWQAASPSTNLLEVLSASA
jgi:hypothetical protein